MSTQRFLGRWSKKGQNCVRVVIECSPTAAAGRPRTQHNNCVDCSTHLSGYLYNYEVLLTVFYARIYILDQTFGIHCQRYRCFDGKSVNEQNLQAQENVPQCLSCQEFYLARFAAMSADRVGLGFFIGQTCALDSTFCTHPGMFLCLAKILCISYLLVLIVSFFCLHFYLI